MEKLTLIFLIKLKNLIGVFVLMIFGYISIFIFLAPHFFICDRFISFLIENEFNQSFGLLMFIPVLIILVLQVMLFDYIFDNKEPAFKYFKEIFEF